MVKCQSCGSTNTRKFSYPEGDIFVCKGCKIQWGVLSKGVSDDNLNLKETHYMTAESYGDYNEYPLFKDFFSTLEQVFGKKKLNILDVGCGSGTFIRASSNKGHNIYGIELVEGVKKFMPKDVVPKVIFDDIRNIKEFQLPKFDVITFWDSFEHIADPFKVIDELRPHLSEKGLIFLQVNNNWDIYNIVSKTLINLAPSIGKPVFRSCFGFHAHLWNFSYQGIKNLLEKNGWKIRKYKFLDTPANRLVRNPILVFIFNIAYMVNRLIRGGKLGAYYISPT